MMATMLPRGMPLATRGRASSEHAWDPMSCSGANSVRKRAPYRRTVALEDAVEFHALLRLKRCLACDQYHSSRVST
jgi:hypothetical protein